MNTTKEQQKELDDALVTPENRLKIGKSNLRLSSNLKSKEPTIQVVLDALKLTPFYNAFEISADVPKIYMQEFWVIVTRHHSLLRFKLDGKSHTVNDDNFRDMLKICPKLPGQKFEEHPLEEDILSFIKDLGHTGEIKFLSDVNGMYHNNQVYYVYLLWEDLVFQVENKNSKKNSDMYYPLFTKVIVDYFMAKDQAIPRRNKMFWHYARDDFIQAMLESKAFKTYRAYATGEKAPKPKATKKKTNSESSPKTKPSQASKGKRIKTSAKGDKPATTKLKGLTVLSKVAFLEVEQMKLVTKRSLKEFHIFHASGSGDGVDILSKVPDEQQQTGSGTNEGAGEDEEEDEEHDSDDENDDKDDDQENDNQINESDDEGDDFVHPNLSTYIADDQEKVKEEEKVDDDDDDVTSDKKVSTPPDYELAEESENEQDDDTMRGE
ncbi:hypothetical protein Tco_1035683 [Tanacetum coccineum]